MNLKCVKTDYRKLGFSKHPLKCQAKCITIPNVQYFTTKWAKKCGPLHMFCPPPWSPHSWKLAPPLLRSAETATKSLVIQMQAYYVNCAKAGFMPHVRKLVKMSMRSLKSMHWYCEICNRGVGTARLWWKLRYVSISVASQLFFRCFAPWLPFSITNNILIFMVAYCCLLYTSDAADE